VVPSWAGFYLGIDGGATGHRGSFNDPDGCCAIAGTGIAATYDVNKTGGIFGGYAGYNWQQRDFVYGVEAGINWVGAKAQAFWGPGAPNAGVFGANYQQSQNVSWLATFRARAGVDIKSTLFYLTGGLAVAQVNDSFNVLCAGGACNGGAALNGTVESTFTANGTRLGWTVGGGFEHMFDPHWSVRGELGYVDLARVNVSCTDLVPATARACTPGTNYRGDFSNTLVTGVVGLGYKF